MAGEEQYYNPIVQAMIATAKKQQEAEQLKAQVENQKAQLAQRKVEADTQAHHLDVQSDLQNRQLEEAKREHDILAEHNSKLLDIQSKAQDLQQQVHHAGILKTINELSSKGFDVRGAAPLLHQLGVAPMQEVQGNLDQSQMGGMSRFQIQSPFTTPSAAAEVERMQARAKAQGESQGALPSQKELGELQFGHAMQLAKERGAEAAALEERRGHYSESVANINGRNHLIATGILAAQGQGDAADMTKQLVDGIHNGNIDPAKLSTVQKQLVERYAAATGELKGLPFSDNKGYQKKLDALSGLQVLLDQYRDLAKNYSIDSPGATDKGNYNMSLGPLGTFSTPFITGTQGQRTGSDLASKLQSATGSAGQLTTMFEQSARKSDAAILRQVGASFDPKATAKQNMDKINSYVQQAQQSVKNMFPGMLPDRINKVLGDRGITDFGGFGRVDRSQYSNIHKGNPGQPDIGLKGGKWYNLDSGDEIKVN